MESLGELLIAHADELVQRWYERWKIEGPAMPGITEAAIKDHLPLQLRAIGEAMRKGGSSESPRELWQRPERSDPEQRVRDDIPIEEVVREYGFVLDEVRSWISEQPQEFSFKEHSFLFLALFELAAESARRYAAYAAEDVKRMRSEYLAGIAHQLRTPVTTLKLTLEQVERRGGVLEPSTLERLQRTMHRLGRLVDGLLRLERFQPSDAPVFPEQLRPAQVVDELLSDHEHEAIRKGLRLEVEVNRSACMVADPDLVVDALGNLIENAIKFTKEGFVRIAVEDGPETIVFRVLDSGPGITRERQEQLFKPVQPERSGGVGLGLSIAMWAARAQGGSIEVESTPGEGSTFELRLPRTVKARRGG